MSFCTRFEKSATEEKETLVEEYTHHMERIKEANESKSSDKQRAAVDDAFVTVMFDLQSVLQIPSCDVSPMYYSRKLCCYNLTIYEGSQSRNAYCYA